MLQLGFNIKCCIANIYLTPFTLYFFCSAYLLSSYVIIYNQLKVLSLVFLTHIHCIMISPIKSVQQILNKRGQVGLKRISNTERTRKRSEVLNQSKREVLLSIII